MQVWIHVRTYDTLQTFVYMPPGGLLYTHLTVLLFVCLFVCLFVFVTLVSSSSSSYINDFTTSLLTLLVTCKIMHLLAMRDFDENRNKY